MKLYLRLLKYIKPYRARITIGIICMGLHALTVVGSMVLLKFIFDNVLVNPDKSAAKLYIGMSALGLLAVYFSKGIFLYIRDYLINNAGQRVVMDIRNELYKHLHTLSLKFYTNERTGNLISTITNDVSNLQSGVSNIIGTLIDSFVTCIGLLAYLFYLNWKLALISLIAFPLAASLLYKFGSRLRNISEQRQEKIADILSVLQETIAGIRIVKAFAMENYEVEKFKKENRSFFDLAMKDLKTSALSGPIMEFIGAIAIALMIVYSGFLVIEGQWTLGGFMAFMGSLLSLYKPINNLNGINNTIQQTIVSSGRVFELLDTEAEIVDSSNAIKINGIKKDIQFKNVTFAYLDKPVLQNINFSVKAGELVAIVGPSGAGKTTLVDLIPRFYDPQKGEITIDGVDLKNIAISSLRSQIGIVTQETILFNDTIANNIAYGKPEANKEEIILASKSANADDFITATELGYNTVIGERGVKLSGGERQRIAIARAVLKNPPILILDEATSALDSESESLVQEALDRLMVNRTTVVIAHRLSTVIKADRIVVLDDGHIVDIGKHAELIKKCELYKRLYELQFSTIFSSKEIELDR